MSQGDGFARVLSQVFHNEPRVAYILPEEVTRRSVLPWFFRSIAIRARQFGGEIYTTAKLDGGILWISPGRELTFARIVQTQMQASKSKLQRSSFRRWINLRAHMQGVHRRFRNLADWVWSRLRRK